MRMIVAGATLLLALMGLAGLAPAADFNGDGHDDIGIFRPAEGKWSIRNVTNIYLGARGDIPVAVDLQGNGTDRAGIFRPEEGLWSVHNLTRVYFGAEGDVPLGKGGYNPYGSYDYIVKAGDAADLVQALESTTLRSVFVPAAVYTVSSTINVTYVRVIAGESKLTEIAFTGNNYLSIENSSCAVENIKVSDGGASASSRGNFHVNAEYVTVKSCRAATSTFSGFSFSSTSNYISFIDCVALSCDNSGFRGDAPVLTARFSNCLAKNCGYGFANCNNLSSCAVDGDNVSVSGFSNCNNISGSQAYDCATNGFYNCDRVSACSVDGNSHTDYGFNSCSYIAACYAASCSVSPFTTCTNTAACNDGP